MKIGIDVQTTHKHKTGFGNYVNNLIFNLKKIDKNNQYLLLKPTDKNDLSTPKRFIWDQFLFPKKAKQSKVDILHQPCFSLPVFYKGKKIITVHDLAIKYYPKGISLPSRTFFSYWMPFTYKFADHIITISNYTKKDIIKFLGIPKNKITVIPLAVDHKLFNANRVSDIKVNKIKKKFSINSEYFFSISELHPRKNLEFLIRVFFDVSKTLNDYKLVLAGKKNKYYDKLFNLANKLKIADKILFIGYVSEEEKIILYKNATIFLFPSYYEGFGLPPLEAMACGTPVISSNTSSLAEIIGNGGILISPTDRKGWVDSVKILATNIKYKKSIVRKAVNQAKKFSWKKCAQSTIQVYKKVLGINENKKKNILIIKNPFETHGFSGGEVHTMQMAHFLRKEGHKVYFAGSCPDLLGKAKEEGFEIEYLDFGGEEAVTKISVIKFFFTWPFIYFKYKKYLQKMKKEKNIDILYLISWNEKFLLAPLAKKLGMKVFFVEHRLMGRFIYLNPFRFLYVYGSNFAKIIAVSQAVKQGLMKVGVKPDKIRVIYNGVEVNEFSRIKRKMFKKDPKEIIIGTISRLSEDKGIRYLLEGFKIASQKDSNLRLKIVGGGPQGKVLINLSKELNIFNKVKFLGRIERKKIPEFINSIDVFVLASIWGESFGIVLVETGIMGKPCIATDIGGMPEVIKNNKTGIIVKPYNSQDIAKAIRKLAGSVKLRGKMGKEARERVKNKFSLNIMLKKINDLFFNE